MSVCVFTCLQFPLGVTNHTLKWEGVWRELGCLARSTSFAVREESGHSLKSALSVSPQLETFSVSLLSLRSCCRSGPRNMFLWLLLTPTLVFQHTMSVDSRNSTIFPSRGALLRLSQVASLQTKLISPLEKALFF